jgi:hypothetical protein
MADEHDQENQWMIAHVGSGASKRDEYLFINRATKMFMTVAGKYNRTGCNANFSPRLTQWQELRLPG